MFLFHYVFMSSSSTIIEDFDVIREHFIIKFQCIFENAMITAMLITIHNLLANSRVRNRMEIPFFFFFFSFTLFVR